MPPTLKVAAAQIAIGPDLATNTRTIVEVINACARQGLDLCVLPEAAVTGYSPTIGRARPAADWPAVRAALDEIAGAAAQGNLGVVVGAEAWEANAWVNRLYAFGRQGETLAAYDKVHLTRDDVAYYRPGERYAVFCFDGVICGLQICYDARFPEGYRALAAQGAQVILQGFYGAGSGTWKAPVLSAHLRSRAAENGCFVVSANVAGPQQIVVSQVIDPLGLVLASANHDRVETIEARLDLARIADSEIRADWLGRFGPMANKG